LARRTKKGELQKVFGTPALFSTAYGNVGSSIYYALGITAAFALGMTPVVFVAAGILFALTALTYAENTAAMPVAGGSSSFSRRAFNEFVSFTAGWALMLDYIITVAISGYFTVTYLGIFYEPLQEWPGAAIGGIVVIMVLVAINVVGTREVARLNITFAVLDLATQVVLVVLGTVVLLSPEILVSNVQLGVAPTYYNLLYSFSLAVVAYTGIETISSMSEEASDPGRQVPKSIILIVVAVLTLYVGISAVSLSAYPVEEVNGRYVTGIAEEYLLDPVQGLVQAMPYEGLKYVMGIYVGILASTILVIATNAGILGVSRLTYSMGRHRQLPRAISRLHPRFFTPFVAIIGFGTIAAVLCIPKAAPYILGDLYAFGSMIAFTVSHVSLIALRFKEPELERPFKAPLNVTIRDRQVPLTAVVGGLGTFAAWILVISTHHYARYIGFAWLLVGLTVYVFYRKRNNLSLTQTVTLGEEKLLEFEGIEYRNILVPVIGDRFSTEAMVMALQLAAEREASVEALYVLELPMNLPLDAQVPELRREASEVLEDMRAMADEYGVELIPKIIPARQAGRAIVEEAKRRKSEVIIIGVERKRRLGERLFGRTVEYVLKNAPCRVVVVTSEKAAAA
jgi:basic amino acid/polyamine antiporter, APA family